MEHTLPLDLARLRSEIVKRIILLTTAAMRQEYRTDTPLCLLIEVQ